MKTSEERYAQLEKELGPFRPLLSRAADTILEQEVSAYPIFLLMRQPVAVGLPLYQPEAGKEGWFVHASTLEELATKKVVSMEKVDSFRAVFKDPGEFFCLFVLEGERAEFIFLPRQSGDPTP